MVRTPFDFPGYGFEMDPPVLNPRMQVIYDKVSLCSLRKHAYAIKIHLTVILNLNLNSLLVKRQIDNPSPGTVTGVGWGWGISP